MKKIKYILLAIVCITINITDVSAHPGRTDSSGCHYCRTNCPKWGLANNEYHCHNSKNNDSNSSTSTNNDSNSSTSTNNNITKIKSSDNSIKELKIGNESIKINDTMTYTTKEKSLILNIVANDPNATIDSTKTIVLTDGENKIDIKVTAENGSDKIYYLNIIKEKELSSNKNIKIFIDNKEIKFISFKNNNITISDDINKLNITYELEDNNSKVEILGNEYLKAGENEIIIRVTAENADTDEYKLIVKKNSEEDKTISGFLGLFLFGGIGYGIYKLIKKRKKN